MYFLRNSCKHDARARALPCAANVDLTEARERHSRLFVHTIRTQLSKSHRLWPFNRNATALRKPTQPSDHWTNLWYICTLPGCRGKPILSVLWCQCMHAVAVGRRIARHYVSHDYRLRVFTTHGHSAQISELYLVNSKASISQFYRQVSIFTPVVSLIILHGEDLFKVAVLGNIV